MLSLLLVSTPVHGHVAPVLNVARHLVSAGHRVRFLTGSRFRSSVEATGAQFLPLPAAADFDDRDLDRAFPGRTRLRGLDRIRFDVEAIFLRPMEAQLEAIDQALALEPADAVLLETMTAAAAPLALRPRAERPVLVNLGIIPLGVPSIDTAPFGLGIAPLPGPLGRLRNALLYRLAEHVVFGRLQRRARADLRRLTGAELPCGLMDAATLLDAIVQFTVPSFEYDRSDLPGNVHFVGPVSRLQPAPIDRPSWWGDLARAKRVVHVTQGTVANADPGELIRPTLDGLAGTDALVVVSTGGRPVEELGPLPANARAAEFLPYDELLPYVDVVVTNGGYGGVHYALERGIPLVVAGRTEDKAEVSARVAWSGAGIDLRTERPAPGAVRDAVRRVLVEPRFAEASARIARDIAAAPGAAGLERILADLVARRAAKEAVPA